jgi:hypothetical protein
MAKFDLKKYLKEGKLYKDKKTLNESCPGYDDRGFGEPLPTLDSIQQDYESSQSEEDDEMEHEEEIEGDDTTEILDDVEELELDINNSTVNIHLNEDETYELTDEDKKYLTDITEKFIDSNINADGEKRVKALEFITNLIK